MRERGGGPTEHAKSPPYPRNAKMHSETRSFELWVSKDEEVVFVVVREYQAGVLFLDKEDLRRLLDAME